MADDSYTLAEVAELLGMSKRTLQRRIQEGAFPGRYLAPGVAGLEMRIPAADVVRAQRELVREAMPEATRTLAPAPIEDRRDSFLPRASEVAAISSAPIFREAVEHSSVEQIRRAVVELVREEREMFLAAVRDALVLRDRELSELRADIGALRDSVETVRETVERFENELQREWRAQADRPAAWSEVLGVPKNGGGVDVDALLRELGELEALVDGLPD